MIDLNEPGRIISSLLENFHNIDILPDLRIYDIYTGNFSDPALNGGIFGVLPLAGTSTGDILALTPLLDKPPCEWPVLKFHNHGGDASFVSTSLTLLPVFAMLGEIRPRYILEDKFLIMKTRIYVQNLSQSLGNDPRTCSFIGFLDSLSAEQAHVFDDYTLYQKAAAPCWLTEFLDTFRKVYMEDGSAAGLWQNFLQQYPFVVPARQLLFGAEAKGGIDAFDAAWKSVTTEYYFNNFIFGLVRSTSTGISGLDVRVGKNSGCLLEEDPRIAAARYIVASGKGREHPAFPAIQLEAEEEPCSGAWMKAAGALLKAGSLSDAYYAYINAGYWFYLENEEFCREAARGALETARALQNPHLEYILAAVQEV